MTKAGFRDLVKSIAASRAPPAPYDAFVGVRIDRLDGDEAALSLTTGGTHHNPGGVTHGGILYGLADSAMAYAVSTTLEADETCTSIDGHVRFLRPSIEGRLTAHARVLKAGRTIVVASCDVRDASGETLAVVSSNFLRMRSSRGARRAKPER